MEPRRVDDAQSRGEGSKWSHGGSWTLNVEAWRLIIEPWRVCMPVVSDLHDSDEEQVPDPESHQCKKSDPDQSDRSNTDQGSATVVLWYGR
jgi:hypothetical protein